MLQQSIGLSFNNNNTKKDLIIKPLFIIKAAENLDGKQQ